MTVLDQQDGNKPARAGGEERHDSASVSSFPPPYGMAKEESILDSFKHVLIPPPKPAPDEKAVDIRVDDDGDDLLLEEQNFSPSPTPPIFPTLTPARITRDLLSASLPWARLIKSFADIDKAVINEVAAAQISSSPPDAAGNPSTSLHGLVTTDMMSALPHRSAIFLPDRLQWIVVAPFQQVRRDNTTIEAVDAAASHLADSEITFPLWRLAGLAQVPSEQQISPIYAVSSMEQGGQEEDELRPVEVFDLWTSTNGTQVLVSPEGSLPSIIPKPLLERFETDRRCNPRPGVTGEVQLRDAVSILLRVIGNAAKGESRALSITGKALSTKFGMDKIGQTILGHLGFAADGKPDESGHMSLIKPPDMTQLLWRIKMRRAWVEIVLRYRYLVPVSSQPEAAFWNEMQAFLPLKPQFDAVKDTLDKLFELDPPSQSIGRQIYVKSDYIYALEFLGAEKEAREELVAQCYLSNVQNLATKAERLPYFTALQTAGQHFVEIAPDSGEHVQTLLAVEKSKGLFSMDDLKGAFSKIGVQITSFEHALTISNDFILSLYTSSVNSVAANKEEVAAFRDALEFISASRNHPEELEAAAAAPVELGLEEAYKILEVNQDTDDDFIVNIFQFTLSDGSKSLVESCEALRVVAEHRESTTLLNQYRHAMGLPEKWEAADMALPIGLNNIGNTCYLNSVLQYFFAIRTLREKVLHASDPNGSSDEVGNALPLVRLAGRQVSVREVERSQRFICQLAQLFSNMISSPASAVTPERELAYLALVSSRVEEINELGDTPVISDDAHKSALASQQANKGMNTTLMDEPASVVEGRYDILDSKTAPSDSTMKEEDNDGFTTPPLPEHHVPSLPPRPVVSALDAGEVGQRRNSLMQLGAQQDVSECLDNVMFQVQVALKASMPQNQLSDSQATIKTDDADEDDGWAEEGDSLRKLFLGRTLQRLEVTKQREEDEEPKAHTKREVFTTLPIDVVEEGRDIYDGLDGFFEEEMLTGSAGETIRRTVALTDGPAILQIQLQRVQYDRIRGAYKSQAYLEVGQTLFMDRYLDFDPLATEDVVRLEKRKKGRLARRRVAELRTRLRDLQPDKMAVSRTLRQSSDFLTSLVCRQVKTDNRSQAQKEAWAGSDKNSSSTLTTTTNVASSQIGSLLDTGLATFLKEEATRVEDEIARAQVEISELKTAVEELWKDERRLEYVLASVFMHRGEASHGHYFLNQRKLTPDESEPSSKWYKYNDQSVTDASWNDVHRDQSGATPYLLCWVRRDKLDHFDTLCRRIGKGPDSVDTSEAQPLLATNGTSSVTDSAITSSTGLSAANSQAAAAVLVTDDTIMNDLEPNE